MKPDTTSFTPRLLAWKQLHKILKLLSNNRQYQLQFQGTAIAIHKFTWLLFIQKKVNSINKNKLSIVKSC